MQLVIPMPHHCPALVGRGNSFTPNVCALNMLPCQLSKHDLILSVIGIPVPFTIVSLLNYAVVTFLKLMSNLTL